MQDVLRDPLAGPVEKGSSVPSVLPNEPSKWTVEHVVEWTTYWVATNRADDSLVEFMKDERINGAALLSEHLRPPILHVGHQLNFAASVQELR
ncbi:hypothetical protein HDU98_005801, partial [Podochytrium sp. JEL0797]